MNQMNRVEPWAPLPRLSAPQGPEHSEYATYMQAHAVSPPDGNLQQSPSEEAAISSNLRHISGDVRYISEGDAISATETAAAAATMTSMSGSAPCTPVVARAPPPSVQPPAAVFSIAARGQPAARHVVSPTPTDASSHVTG